jgi:hypothetical protein
MSKAKIGATCDLAARCNIIQPYAEQGVQNHDNSFIFYKSHEFRDNFFVFNNSLGAIFLPLCFQ